MVLICFHDTKLTGNYFTAALKKYMTVEQIMAKADNIKSLNN